MIEFNDIDRREWRKLGFYYTLDEEKHSWKFFGDKSGLEGFSAALISHASTKGSEHAGEHIHLGPHSYLKIVTGEFPVITLDGIYGRQVI